MKKFKVLITLLFVSVFCFNKIYAQYTFTINTNAAGRHAISPYIYGVNSDVINAADKYKSFRLGGTRMNSYNWENNASNAGADWFDQNDNYVCTWQNTANCNLPAQPIIDFYNRANSFNNAYTLVTLPAMGFVSADKNGTTVLATETAPSARFVPTQDVKGSAFSLSPDLVDNKVYIDEEVNFLKTTLGTAASGGIKAYGITNEAGIWSTQTQRIHPVNTTCAELLNRTISIASAVKNVDNTAEIFGGNCYGFGEYYDMQTSADWSTISAANPAYNWFLDYYLDNMKTASTTAGKRLMDVLSIHWYPEASGDDRIASSSAYTTNDITARLQAPRTLWDNTYTTYDPTAPYINGENSWITQYFGQGSWTGHNYFPLIQNIQSSINTYYPGTKLALGEYNYGGGTQITGGLTQADVLGIFGKYNIYYANYWQIDNETNFISPAFQLYTNYDGTGKMFGNNSVTSSTSDVRNSSVYTSIDGSSDGVLHVMAINKKNSAQTATFNITSGTTYTKAKVYQLDGSSTTISHKADVTGIVGNTFTYNLPAYSAIHFVIGNLITLPIQLINFNALLQNNIVQLNWKTAEEINLKSFEVEKSVDGNLFEKITSQNSKGNNSYYNIVDARPYEGLNYYRLKIIDNDGSFKYSEVAKIKFVNNKKIYIFPNPANDKITCTFSTTIKDLNSISLFDVLGKRVNVNIIQLNSNQIFINSTLLASGVYYLKVSNMGIFQTQKIIIKH